MSTFNLTRHFDEYFEVVPVRDGATREEVFRLRFAVYCEELGYEDPSAFPDGLEKDDYDGDSEFALLRHKASGRSAGCVRLIINERSSELRFPFESACRGYLNPEHIDLGSLNRDGIGEISRLAVHQVFRRRQGEAGSPEGLTEPASHVASDRRYPLVAMGLFISASALAINRGLEQVIVMMEPRLARMLNACGISFTQIGDVIDYHGRRGPFRITRSELLENLESESRQLLQVMMERLS